MYVYTGGGQTNGNSAYNVNIYLLIIYFAFNTAAVLLGMGSYKF
jgi:hypothetical protein